MLKLKDRRLNNSRAALKGVVAVPKKNLNDPGTPHDFHWYCNFKKNEHGEYVLKCQQYLMRQWLRYESGDYFTKDLQDAKDTLLSLQKTQNR